MKFCPLRNFCLIYVSNKHATGICYCMKLFDNLPVQCIVVKWLHLISFSHYSLGDWTIKKSILIRSLPILEIEYLFCFMCCLTIEKAYLITFTVVVKQINSHDLWKAFSLFLFTLDLIKNALKYILVNWMYKSLYYM